MSQIQVAVSSVIDAPAEAVYTILADYHNHHPQILPQSHFTSIEVEEGGYGAGNILRFTMEVFGNKQEYHSRVTEPEPGRVLAETDMLSGAVTTFTVTPAGAQSDVTIATTVPRQPGLRGFIEGLMTSPILRRIYRQELQNLNQYAQRIEQ
ncbi:MAG TPA: SRPBCC family protein [Anaerolineae bacterium]